MPAVAKEKYDVSKVPRKTDVEVPLVTSALYVFKSA